MHYTTNFEHWGLSQELLRVAVSNLFVESNIPGATEGG